MCDLYVVLLGEMDLLHTHFNTSQYFTSELCK